MNINKKKLSLILISLAILIASYFLIGELKENYIFSIKVISNNEYQTLIVGKSETLFEDLELQLNNESIAKLENNNYFLVQKNDEDYEGSLGTKDNKYRLAILKEDKSKLDLMKDGEPLKLIVYNDTSYEMVDIYITYIPIVEISDSNWAEQRENEKDLYTGYISIYNYVSDNTYQKEKYFSLYHLRGNSTLDSTKRSYSIDLLDDNWNKKKVSLLGMREDDDWNLMAMSIDASMMKEKLSMEIWNYYSDYPVESRYVELIKDGKYLGLYLLTEPVDRKTLGGSTDDILIKVNNWYSREIYGESGNNSAYCQRNDKCTFEDITFKNLTIDDEDEMVKIANALHDLHEGKDNDLFEFDYNNCLDYSLYLQITMACDSTYKNERMLLIKDGDKYKLIKGAWDYDYNFRTDHLNEDYYDYILPLEYKESDEFKKDVAKLYNSIKDFYNIDSLTSKIEEYDTYITNSGALSRIVKNNRYSEGDDYGIAVNDLKNVIKQRIEYLNEYYENILKETN